MNKKWVFPPVSFFERKEVCPCQVQAMERRESLWSLLKLTQQSEAFESVQRTQSVASTDLFFSVHTEGALVHERKSWSGLCSGHWKPFQVHGLLWSISGLSTRHFYSLSTLSPKRVSSLPLALNTTNMLMIPKFAILFQNSLWNGNWNAVTWKVNWRWHRTQHQTPSLSHVCGWYRLSPQL